MAADADPLTGRVVLVSGATGEVGAAFVRSVRARGVRTAIAVRRPWQVEAVRSAFGTEALLCGCVPTGDGEAAAGFIKGATDALGPIDAFVCTSGAFAGSTVGRDDAGELRDLLAANLLAGATLARAVVGPMKRRRTGSLVFVGSAQVGHGGAGLANYLASKAALHEWVRALHAELAGSGVRAVVVAPGPIDTAKARAARPDAEPREGHSLEAVVRALVDAAFAPSVPAPLYPMLPAG